MPASSTHSFKGARRAVRCALIAVTVVVAACSSSPSSPDASPPCFSHKLEKLGTLDVLNSDRVLQDNDEVVMQFGFQGDIMAVLSFVVPMMGDLPSWKLTVEAFDDQQQPMTGGPCATFYQFVDEGEQGRLLGSYFMRVLTDDFADLPPLMTIVATVENSNGEYYETELDVIPTPLPDAPSALSTP